jgi:hypothetical protein
MEDKLAIVLFGLFSFTDIKYQAQMPSLMHTRCESSKTCIRIYLRLRGGSDMDEERCTKPGFMDTQFSHVQEGLDKLQCDLITQIQQAYIENAWSCRLTQACRRIDNQPPKTV